MSLGALALFIVGLCRSRSGGDHPGAYYHSGLSPRTSMFTGFSLCGVTLTLALSSTILAGIRRATGLTISRTSSSSPAKAGFKAKINARMLAWYDARVEQIEQRAEAHIQRIIARHAHEIPDENIRTVWEQQVRADVMHKVERIKERREMCPLGGRHGDGSRSQTPLLDAYLYMGEKLFDWLVDWMRRNPHFVDERDAAALAIEEAEDALAFNSFALPAPKPSHRNEPQHPPVPYIAVAGPSSADDRATTGSPEPSAPALSESEFLGFALKQQTTSLPVPAPTVSLSSRSPRIVELQQQLGFDPPPYTPVDEQLTDAAADIPAASSSRRSRRNVAAAAASKDEVSELKPSPAYN
ncbi:hypothetical protein GGI15_004252 [Coemansia interrupta]|uniref:Uncharacterized protein n=1 Tax=Coemansia interrupta TaxID=1126814 RepID=A0A9W8H9W2_9FUNG|nr:hypothetical protein GGI15_004252 [Coemansia interrupta]